ncbi:hypothetical protein NDU88_001674 [Pleurodeles waltl]|uniref:Uncharacterized protein n=1 Tax=Pleurodeles waltl TaxID=8319 RepID=A0AAV7KQT3_PLEWA|nr:hypothetical protein NDU88_001674 [Pleurodeles waltl]
MAGPRSHKKDTLIIDLLMKVPGKGIAQTDDTQPGQSNAMGDSIISTDDTELVTRTFMESLFGALCTDIATLKQDLARDIKGLTKDMNEVGDCVDTLERSSNTQVEELDAYRCEILELQDRNADLGYQMEDQENRSRRANIRI